MEPLRPTTGNTLGGFLFILLILCLPNVSNKYYHDTGADQFSAQHKGVLVIFSWGNVVSAHGAAAAYNGKSLGNLFLLYILLILCIPNLSNKSYHVTGADQLYAQHKGVMVSIYWYKVVLVPGSATAYNRESLGNLFFYIFY